MPVLPKAALEVKDEPADDRVAADVVEKPPLSVEKREEEECMLPPLAW